MTLEEIREESPQYVRSKSVDERVMEQTSDVARFDGKHSGTGPSESQENPISPKSDHHGRGVKPGFNSPSNATRSSKVEPSNHIQADGEGLLQVHMHTPTLEHKDCGKKSKTGLKLTGEKLFEANLDERSKVKHIICKLLKTDKQYLCKNHAQHLSTTCCFCSNKGLCRALTLGAISTATLNRPSKVQMIVMDRNVYLQLCDSENHAEGIKNVLAKAQLAFHDLFGFNIEAEKQQQLIALKVQAQQHSTREIWNSHFRQKLTPKAVHIANILGVTEEWPLFLDNNVSEYENVTSLISQLDPEDHDALRILFTEEQMTQRLATIHVMKDLDSRIGIQTIAKRKMLKLWLKQGVSLPIITCVVKILDLHLNETRWGELTAEEIDTKTLGLYEIMCGRLHIGNNYHTLYCGEWFHSPTHMFLLQNSVLFGRFQDRLKLLIAKWVCSRPPLVHKALSPSTSLASLLGALHVGMPKTQLDNLLEDYQKIMNRDNLVNMLRMKVSRVQKYNNGTSNKVSIKTQMKAFDSEKLTEYNMFLSDISKMPISKLPPSSSKLVEG